MIAVGTVNTTMAPLETTKSTTKFITKAEPITSEVLEMRTRKNVKVMGQKTEMKSVEKAVELLIKPDQKSESMSRLSLDYFSNELMTVIQSGNRSKNIEQTADATEMSEFVKGIPMGQKVEKGKELSTELLNNEKMTFRSGYQGQGTINQSAEYDRLLKDTSQKIKLEKMEGSLNGANCYNGYSRAFMFF